MARNGIKTGGRKKGSINKATAETKQRALFVMEIIEAQYLEKDIKAISPAQRMQLYGGLMEYVLPKLARIDAKIEGELRFTNEIIF